MDFIDDELPEKVQAEFLSHSASCLACRKELEELQCLKRTLAGLPCVSVSSEFDFRLKASLHLEESRLRSPVYRMKLFLKENLASTVVIPAAAAMLMFGGVMIYNNPFHGTQLQTVEQKAIDQNQLEASKADGSASEDVHYVLESVDLSEAGTAAVPNGNTGIKLSSVNSINLIRY